MDFIESFSFFVWHLKHMFIAVAVSEAFSIHDHFINLNVICSY